MKQDFKNEVTLTLRISNDSEKRKAINKISDKLICIRTYLQTGKNKEGNYNPLLDFEVQLFTENSQNPTKTNFDNGLKPGDYITVKGTLSSKGYVINNILHKTMVIYASEITTVEEAEEREIAKSIWN